MTIRAQGRNPLPDEISTRIFKLLDGGSLQRARLVCKDWDNAIKDYVLGQEEEDRKSEMEAMLRHQWRHNTPSLQSTSISIEDFDDVDDFEDFLWVSRKALAISTMEGITVYNFKEGTPPLQITGRYIRHFSSRVMITSTVYQVKIWDPNTGIKIFDHIVSNPPFCLGNEDFDKLKQELIIEDLRFKINQDLSVSQVSHKPLPLIDGREPYILRFHHPHYICRDGNALLIMRFDDQQQQYQQVSRLVAGLRIHSFFVDFYPFKSSIISVWTSHMNHPEFIKISSCDSDSHQDFPLLRPNRSSWDEVEVNDLARVLVVVEREMWKYFLLIYDLDRVCDGDTSSPRRLVLTETFISDFGILIAKDRSSVTAVFTDKNGSVTHTVLDFWNTAAIQN